MAKITFFLRVLDTPSCSLVHMALVHVCVLNCFVFHLSLCYFFTCRRLIHSELISHRLMRECLVLRIFPLPRALLTSFRPNPQELSRFSRGSRDRSSPEPSIVIVPLSHTFVCYISNARMGFGVMDSFKPICW